MKKFFSIVIILILTLCLAACGSLSVSTEEKETSNIGDEENADENIDITLWTYPVGGWGNTTAVAGLISRFNKVYPNIHVSVKCLDYTDGDNEVEEAIKNGQLPDLIFEGPERLIANWGDRGLMADLSDLWSEGIADEIYDNIKDACKHSNGEFYEFPVCMTAHCMAINYDMFESAGALQYIDLDSHTWTTDEFIKAVQALTASGQENVGVVYCNNQGGDQGTRALVTNLYGGSFTDGEHKKYTVNNEENIKALQLLNDLDGIRFDSTMAGGDEAASFSKGELAMAFCWNVSIEISQTVANSDRNFDIFPMAFPTESGEPKLQGGIWGFGAFDNGDEARLSAAKSFIKFMTMDDAQYTSAVQTSTYWPVRDMDDIYVNDGIMTEYGIFMKYLGDYYQITPGWQEARTAWWNMLQAIGSGEDISVAVEEFDRTANAAVDGE